MHKVPQNQYYCQVVPANVVGVDPVRQAIAQVLANRRHEYLTASGIQAYVLSDHPELSEKLSVRAIGEILKTFPLQVQRVRTNIYLCKRQFYLP
jgi:hypothetical protein